MISIYKLLHVVIIKKPLLDISVKNKTAAREDMVEQK